MIYLVLFGCNFSASSGSIFFNSLYTYHGSFFSFSSISALNFGSGHISGISKFLYIVSI